MSQAPAKRNKGEIVSAATTLDARIEELRDAGKLHDTPMEGEDAVAAMVDRILNADTPDDILGGTMGADALVGRAILIKWVNFVPSDVREGHFAVVGFSEPDDLDREQVFTCGSVRMIAQLVAFASRDYLPVAAKVGSASVEFEPGHYGDTYFLTRL